MKARNYIAAPYTAPTEELKVQNVNNAIKIGNELIDLGFNVFVPHLSHYQHTMKNQPYEKWMEIDFDWLSSCDYLIRLSGESKGADREVEFALAHNIKVFYSVQDLLEFLSYIM